MWWMRGLQRTNYMKNQSFTYRKLKPQDAESYLNLQTQIAKETTHTNLIKGKPSQNLDQVKNRFAYALKDKTILHLGVFDEKKIIGYLNFKVTHPDHPWLKHTAQFGMYILKKYWGLGIGKELLKHQEKYARKIKVTRIEAMVRAANKRGVSLYQKMGFEIEGTRKNAALIGKKYVDEYYIGKILD